MHAQVAELQQQLARAHAATSYHRQRALEMEVNRENAAREAQEVSAPCPPLLPWNASGARTPAHPLAHRHTDQPC
jgi:hypothetical protein